MIGLSLFLVLAAPPHPEARDIEFRADFDGSAQRYVLLPPPGYRAGEVHDVLIALHGHGSDRWQFVQPSREETRAALDAAARHRLIYLSPDYRATKSWMGPAAEADLVQIIAGLKRQYRTGRILLCGASMGGSAALTFAVLHPDLVNGVVSMNGTANHLEYDKFQDAIAESFGGRKDQIPAEYKKRSAEYWPERLSMPVAITASGQDESVPPQSVLRLAGVMRKMGRKVLLIYRPDRGHTTGYDDATTALDWVLAGGN
jgi:pimeloyl-ACP methyl ester carboxylesterase